MGENDERNPIGDLKPVSKGDSEWPLGGLASCASKVERSSLGESNIPQEVQVDSLAGLEEQGGAIAEKAVELVNWIEKLRSRNCLRSFLEVESAERAYDIVLNKVSQENVNIKSVSRYAETVFRKTLIAKKRLKCLKSYIGDGDVMDPGRPEPNWREKEKFEALLPLLRKRLSSLECKVLNLVSQAESMEELARLAGVRPGCVYVAFSRIAKKATSLLVNRRPSPAEGSSEERHAGDNSVTLSGRSIAGQSSPVVEKACRGAALEGGEE